MSRGLATAGMVALVVVVVCAVVGHEVQRNLITAVVVACSLFPLMVRFHRFGFYFADQIWHDFVALSAPPQPTGNVSARQE